MGFSSKSILLLGLIGWMFTACTANRSDSDSEVVTTESAVADSITILVPSESEPTRLNDTSTQSNTSNRIEDAQQKLRDQLGEGNDGQNQTAPKYRLDVEPYNYFADSEGYVTFKGRTLAEIQQILGDAPIVVKQSIKGAPIRKEVRVYMPYSEDATGLYLFIQNEIVQDFRLDEFNGIQNSSILEFFESR